MEINETVILFFFSIVYDSILGLQRSDLNVVSQGDVCALLADFSFVHSSTHRYTMVTAMGYLTACQVSRVFIFNYGILSTDFSG